MVFEKIKKIIIDELGITDKEITLQTNFVDDLEVDSLDLFQVVNAIEDEFNITIEEVEQLKTIEDVVKYVEKASAK